MTVFGYLFISMFVLGSLGYIDVGIGTGMIMAFSLLFDIGYLSSKLKMMGVID